MHTKVKRRGKHLTFLSNYLKINTQIFSMPKFQNGAYKGPPFKKQNKTVLHNGDDMTYLNHRQQVSWSSKQTNDEMMFFPVIIKQP